MYKYLMLDLKHFQISLWRLFFIFFSLLIVDFFFPGDGTLKLWDLRNFRQPLQQANDLLNIYPMYVASWLNMHVSSLWLRNHFFMDSFIKITHFLFIESQLKLCGGG